MKIRLGKFDDISLLNYIDLTVSEKLAVLAMRNHPNIKCWMYNQSDISEQEHFQYIELLKNDFTKQYFLVKKNGTTIGTINFIKIDYQTRCAEFGLYASPFEKIVGVGRILEEVSISYAFNELKLNILKLEVFSDNTQVINLHRKYGFEKVAAKCIAGQEIVCMKKSNANTEQRI